MGAYKPYLGILNGYYVLDLSKKMDQIALTRLLEQSQTDNTRRQAFSPLLPGRMGDTSQCGNWTSFRNEFLNGKRFAIHPEKFRPMPKSGKLCFDYCMVARPPITDDLIILSDRRLVKILYNIFLVSEEDMPKYLKMLEMWRKDLKNNAKGKGGMKLKYEYSKEKGLGLGHAVTDFYENLEMRMKLYSEGFSRENVKVDYQKKKKKKTKKGKKDKDDTPEKKPVDGLAAVMDGAEDTETGEGEGNVANKADNKHDATAGGEENKEGDEGGDEGMKGEESDDESEEEEEHHVKREKKMSEEMAKYKALIESPLVSDQAKAARIVELIEDMFAHVWILCRHLAAIIVAFPCGSSARTDFFGSYHVDLIVSLFNRIVDIHNFEVIMSVLNAQECAQVYCRIGWLNIFNPTKPEGYWVVDFNRYEERMVGKMLIGLAIVEPGDNWKDAWFRWGWDIDVVPGWELTEGYTKDESLTLKGIMCGQYYSGRGKQLEGCVAHLRMRKAMYSLVLCSEEIASIDFDEKFPYLSARGDDNEEDDDGEVKEDGNDKAKEVGDEESVASNLSLSSLQNDSNIPSELPGMANRELLPGEMWLRANTTMWDQLYAPVGGVAEKTKKNPLALIFQSGVMEEGSF
jgi:hypothetical protein